MSTLHPLQPIAARWPEIETLLDEALALPPPDWPAWLASLQQRDPGLRDTLAQLLRGHAQAETDDFLNTLPPLQRLGEGAAPDTAAAGRRVGPWRLLSPLGSGGMGTVWLAERADGTVKRQVALKLPRRGWDNAMAQRMARERDILAALEHPHIARLYEASTDADGRPYLAMEFVPGQPIDEWCTTHAVPVASRLKLLLQVAQAVSHAHTRLVVHRDLKPANILVTAEGQVRLLDFGIAKLLEGDHTQDTALTQLSGRAMTPDYASPEQIRGEPLTTASDLYSLAVVAFELLAGMRPYKLKRGSAAELEEAIETAEPALASSMAESTAMKAALRGDLDAILNRALKKRPDERYPSVSAFAEDIQRHLEGLPVLARPDSKSYRMRKFVGRHRLGVAAAAALLLAVGVGSGTSLWQAQIARAEAGRADAALNEQAAINSLYVNALTRLGANAAANAAALAQPHAVSRVLEATLDEALPRYADRPAERAAMLGSVAEQLNYASDFERSLAVGQRYLADLKAQRAPAGRIIVAHSLLGRTLFQLGRLDESEAIRRAGVAFGGDAQSDTRRALIDRLELVADLVSILNFRGKRAEAQAVLARYVPLAEAQLPQDMATVQLLSLQAETMSNVDDVAALVAARRAVQRMRQITSVPEDRGDVLDRLALALTANGQAALAEPLRAEALGIRQDLFGRANTNVARAVGALAITIARRGDIERASALLAAERAALAGIDAPPARIAEQVLRGYQLFVARLHGDVAAMRTLLDEAAAPQTTRMTDRQREALRAEEAQALVAVGRMPQALALAQPLAERATRRGLPAIGWFSVAQALALAQLASGDAAAARDTAAALVRLHREQRGLRSGTAIVSLEIEALAAARLGDTDAPRRTLAELDALAASPQPPGWWSPVEAAESALRRAEINLLTGQPARAAILAREAQQTLTPLQHPSSPQLAQARSLLAAAEAGTESAAQRVRQ